MGGKDAACQEIGFHEKNGAGTECTLTLPRTGSVPLVYRTLKEKGCSCDEETGALGFSPYPAIDFLWASHSSCL